MNSIDRSAVDPDGKLQMLRGQPVEDATLDNLRGVAPLPAGWVLPPEDERFYVLVVDDAVESDGAIDDRRPWAS